MYQVPDVALPGPNPQLAKKQTSYLSFWDAHGFTGTELIEGLYIPKGFTRMAYVIEWSGKSNSSSRRTGEAEKLAPAQSKTAGRLRSPTLVLKTWEISGESLVISPS